MKRAILVILLFMAGCSSPQLFVGKEIGIHTEHGTLSVSAKKISSDQITLSSVYINRTLYAIGKGRNLVYEEASVASEYAFQYEVKQTLDLVFKAKRVKRLDRIGNFGFYTIAFENGSTLLAVAQNMNMRGIKIVYGLDQRQMKEVMSRMGAKSVADVDAITDVVVLPDTEAAFLSQWNAALIIMDGLIERVGGKPTMM